MDKVSHQASTASAANQPAGVSGDNKLFHDFLLQHIEGLPGLTGFTMMQVQFSLEEMHFTKILCILAPFLDNLVEDITIEIVHFIHSHQFWCDC